MLCSCCLSITTTTTTTTTTTDSCCCGGGSCGGSYSSDGWMEPLDDQKGKATTTTASTITIVAFPIQPYGTYHQPHHNDGPTITTTTTIRSSHDGFKMLEKEENDLTLQKAKRQQRGSKWNAHSSHFCAADLLLSGGERRVLVR
jgi:hypothetical protein